MSVKISQLIQVPVVWGNAVIPIVSKVSGANVTYTANIAQINSYVSGGLYTAIDQTASVLNANIALANLTLRVYTDGQITAANAGVTSANLGMKGYVDSTNQGTISYVDGQINAANVGVLLANAGMKGYVDSTVSSNISVVNNSITAANVGLKGYVDFANTIQSSQIGAANLAITAANVGMKGYVDQTNSIQTQLTSAANVGMRGYVDSTVSSNISTVNNSVTAANVGMRGYVDNTVSSNISVVNNAITAANVGMKGYVDQANTIQKSYTDGQIAAANTASYSNAKVATYLSVGNIANVSVAGNVTATFFIGNGALLTGITTGSSYSNVQVATYLPTYTGTVSASLVNSSGNVLANTVSAVTVNSGLVNSSGNILGATASFGAINSTGFINTTGNLSNGGNTFHAGNTFQGTVGAVSGQFHTFVGNINQFTSGGAVYFNTTGNVLGAGANFGTIRTTGNLIFANAYIPATATSTGTQGQISFDGLYIYICIATNVWRRANVAAW